MASLRWPSLSRSALLMILFIFASLALAKPLRAASTIDASVVSVDEASKTIVLATPHQQSFMVGGTDIQTHLDSLSTGDQVHVALAPDGTTLLAITKAKIAISVINRLIAIGAALLILGFITALVTQWQPRKLILGLDGRYSNSKTQLAIWSAVLATTYLSTLFLRFWVGGADYLGGIDIPENLAALSGFSALSYGGAKAITNQKAANAIASNLANKTDIAAGLVQAAPEKDPLPAEQPPNLVRDLFQSDIGRTDIGDFQMILVTIIAAIIYIIKIFAFQGQLELASTITLPDIDTTLLAGFGAGQGAYILKKMASNPSEG